MSHAVSASRDESETFQPVIAEQSVSAASSNALAQTPNNINNAVERSSRDVGQPPAYEATARLPELLVLVDACDLFVKLFPELGFFHRPSFNDQLRAGVIDEMTLCAILAVTSRYIPSLTAQYGGSHATSEYFARRARDEVMKRVLEKPNPEVVQSLILLGLQDWGTCNSFRAWMYTGMAIRMAQALRAELDDTASVDDASADGALSHTTAQECIRRSIWGSFVMDCMLGGGKYRPQSFQAARMDLTLPCNETDFAFQSEPDEKPSYLMRLSLSSGTPSDGIERLDCDHSLSLIIRGLDVWSTLSAWICAGGRRLESDSPQSAPWKETSFWHRLKDALLGWRNLTSPRLHYLQDGRNLQAHMSRAQGEPFVFINLIFYLNQIFLHREYIPFLPHRCSFPAGPIDPPLLVEKAPDGWWNTNSRILFESAANAVDLIRSAQRRGQECRTIFNSFAIYTAAATLLYAHAWPHMAPDATDTLEDYRWALAWLEDAAGLWEMVVGWVDTLHTVSKLYDRINADKARFPLLGRGELTILEDQINRFAEVEPPPGVNRTPGGDGAAEALLTLAQHGQDVQGPGAARDVHTDVETMPSGQDQNEQDQALHYPDYNVDPSIYNFAGMIDYNSHQLLASQDLLASIMGDGSNEWSHY